MQGTLIKARGFLIRFLHYQNAARTSIHMPPHAGSCFCCKGRALRRIKCWRYIGAFGIVSGFNQNGARLCILSVETFCLRDL